MTKPTITRYDQLNVAMWTLVGLGGGIWALVAWASNMECPEWSDILTGGGFFLAGVASLSGFISDWESRERDAVLAVRIDELAVQINAKHDSPKDGQPGLCWRAIKALLRK